MNFHVPAAGRLLLGVHILALLSPRPELVVPSNGRGSWRQLSKLGEVHVLLWVQGHHCGASPSLSCMSLLSAWLPAVPTCQPSVSSHSLFYHIGEYNTEHPNRSWPRSWACSLGPVSRDLLAPPPLAFCLHFLLQPTAFLLSIKAGYTREGGMRKSHGNRRKNECFLEALFWLLYKHGSLQFSHYFLLIHDVSGTFLGKVHMQWKTRRM